MTFIVVPHGGRDLNTRSFEVSYRRLRTVGVLLLLGAVTWVAAIGWALVNSARAARVPALEREVERLQLENQQVAELAAALRRLERQYEEVREMLGAERPVATEPIWLGPPAGAGAERSSELPR